MHTKSIADERLAALKAQVQQIMELRLSLIDLTKKTATAATVDAEGLLNVVFTRKYTASHMNQWWAERNKQWLRRFETEAAYDAVAAKLTPEERATLGIREPVSRRPKKKPAKKQEPTGRSGFSFDR
jgi:hypothetical protein